MKRLHILLLSLSAIFLTSCASHYKDTAAFHSSGRAKPLIAVLPLIDSTGSVQKEYPWDKSEEFTTEIRKCVADSPHLYLLNLAGGLNAAQTLNTPHVNEIPEDLIQNLAPAEFAIVSELIDERITPYPLKKPNAKKNHLGDVGSKISIALRVRVIDLRGREPKIALQEVIYHDHEVAKAYAHCDYSKNHWGSARYETTPFGIAHNHVIRGLVSRVEGYIGL